MKGGKGKITRNCGSDRRLTRENDYDILIKDYCGVLYQKPDDLIWKL